MGRLALFPDIHLRDGYASEIKTDLRTAINSISNGNLDHAFALGDLIEDSDSVATDKRNIKQVRKIFDDAPFPVTYLLGNHDVEALSRDDLSSILNQDKFYGVFKTADIPIIYLNSTIEGTPGARGELGPRQREWLADACSEYNEPLILSHHPFGNFDISGNEWYKNYPERAFLSDRKEALDLLEEAGPARGTISGHIHQSGFTSFRGVPHVSVNAFSKEVPDKPLTGTYAEVEVGDRISVDVKVHDETLTSYTIL
jgi:3',5'-cyclic AMP phosphodiesterase CpdA